jgi:hypothetical protein
LCDEKINTALGCTLGVTRAIQQDRPVLKASKGIIVHSLAWFSLSCSVESYGAFLPERLLYGLMVRSLAMIVSSPEHPFHKPF